MDTTYRNKWMEHISSIQALILYKEWAGTI
jgi:hypothetical protein